MIGAILIFNILNFLMLANIDSNLVDFMKYMMRRDRNE